MAILVYGSNTGGGSPGGAGINIGVALPAASLVPRAVLLAVTTLGSPPGSVSSVLVSTPVPMFGSLISSAYFGRQMASSFFFIGEQSLPSAAGTYNLNYSASGTQSCGLVVVLTGASIYAPTLVSQYRAATSPLSGSYGIGATGTGKVLVVGSSEATNGLYTWSSLPSDQSSIRDFGVGSVSMVASHKDVSGSFSASFTTSNSVYAQTLGLVVFGNAGAPTSQNIIMYAPV